MAEMMASDHSGDSQLLVDFLEKMKANKAGSLSRADREWHIDNEATGLQNEATPNALLSLEDARILDEKIQELVEIITKTSELSAEAVLARTKILRNQNLLPRDETIKIPPGKGTPLATDLEENIKKPQAIVSPQDSLYKNRKLSVAIKKVAARLLRACRGDACLAPGQGGIFWEGIVALAHEEMKAEKGEPSLAEELRESLEKMMNSFNFRCQDCLTNRCIRRDPETSSEAVKRRLPMAK